MIICKIGITKLQIGTELNKGLSVHPFIFSGISGIPFSATLKLISS